MGSQEGGTCCGVRRCGSETHRTCGHPAAVPPSWGKRQMVGAGRMCYISVHSSLSMVVRAYASSRYIRAPNTAFHRLFTCPSCYIIQKTFFTYIST